MSTHLASRTAMHMRAPGPYPAHRQGDRVGAGALVRRIRVLTLAVLGVMLALLYPLASASQASASTAVPAGGNVTAQAQPFLPSLITGQADEADDEGEEDEDEDSGSGDDEEEGPSAGQLNDLFGDEDVASEYCEEGQSAAECADSFDVEDLMSMVSCIGDEDIIACVKESLEEDRADEASATPEVNYSFYALSSINTAFLFDALGMTVDTAAADGNEDEDSEDNEDIAPPVDMDVDAASGMPGNWASRIANPANAGAFMGFCDANVTPGACTKYYGMPSTKNVVPYSYDSFRAHMEGGDEETSQAAGGVYQYALFGATTAELGLTQNVTTGLAMDAERMFMGNAMLFAFAASGSIDAFFGIIIDALWAINPFRLFFEAVQEADVSDGYEIADEAASGPLEDLASFIATLYNGLVNMGWLVTIPIFIGLFFMGTLMLRRYDTGSNAKKLFVRIFFLSLGFILLGSTYTATLDSFRGYGTDSGSVNSSKVVLNTYLDYDAWVNQGRMAIPATAELSWDEDNKTPTDEAVSRLRNSTFSLNVNSNPAYVNLANEASWADQDIGFVGDALADEQNEGNEWRWGTRGVFAETWSLLNRYTNGDVLTAEGFEGRVKAGLDKVILEETVLGDAAQTHQFTAYSDVGVMKNMTDDEVGQYAMAFVEGDSGLSAAIGENEDGNITYRFSTTPGSTGTVCTTDDVAEVDEVNGGRLRPVACNLSPLAQYNFLNTNFDTAEANVQSSEITDNAYARNSHAAVSQVGGGMMGFLYWISALSVLGAFIAIGIFYALAMLFSNIKRSIQLIAAVPFATLGFMGGIAKVVIYTLAMIAEIILTLFIYRVMQELILAIPAILEAPLVAAFGGEEGALTFGFVAVGMGALFANNMVVGTILTTLSATAGVLIFTIVAIKMRGTLISAIDEAVTNMINKLLDTSVGSGSGGGSGSALRRSLGTAGAMAMGHRLASGGDGGGEDMPDSGTGTTGGGGGADGDGPDGGAGYSNAAYSTGIGTGDADGFGGGSAMGAEGANGVSFDENGQPVGPDGQPLGRDEDGNYVDENGNAMYDAAGNPINDDAETDGAQFTPASMAAGAAAGTAAGAGLANLAGGADAAAQGLGTEGEAVGEGIGVSGASGEELANAGGQEIGDSGIYQMPDGSLAAASDSPAAQAMNEAGVDSGEVGISSATGEQLEAAGAQELGEGSGLYQMPNGDVVAAADSEIAEAAQEAQASDIDSALAGSDGHVAKSAMTGAQLEAAGAEEITKGSGLYDTGGGAVVAASDSAIGQSLGEAGASAQLAGASGEQLEGAGATALGDSGLYETEDGSIVAANDSAAGQALAGNAAAGAAGGIAASSMTSGELADAGATEVGGAGSGVFEQSDGSMVAASDSAAGQALAERAEAAGASSGQALISGQTGEQLAAAGASEIGNSGMYETADGSVVAASDSAMAANASLAGAATDVPASSMTGEQLAASGASEIGDSGVYQTADGGLVAAADSEAAQTGAQAFEYGQTSGEQTVGAMSDAAAAGGLSGMQAAGAGATAANLANAFAGDADHTAGAPDPSDAKATMQSGMSALGDAINSAPAAFDQMKENIAEETGIDPAAFSTGLGNSEQGGNSGLLAGAGVVAGGASIAAIAAQAQKNREQGMSAPDAMRAATEQLNGGVDPSTGAVSTDGLAGGQNPEAGAAQVPGQTPVNPNTGGGGANFVQAGMGSGGSNATTGQQGQFDQRGQHLGPLTGGNQPAGTGVGAHGQNQNLGNQPGQGQFPNQGQFVQASNTAGHNIAPVANTGQAQGQGSSENSGSGISPMMGMMAAQQAVNALSRPSAPERSVRESINGGGRNRGGAGGGQQGGGTAGAMLNAGMRGAMRGGMSRGGASNPMMMGAMMGQTGATPAPEGGGVTPAPQAPGARGNQGAQPNFRNAGHTPGERPGAGDREDRLRESKERRELADEMRKDREQRERDGRERRGEQRKLGDNGRDDNPGAGATGSGVEV